ncbi:MAG: ATP-dependent zinc metalloprotease FtsH [candidate division TM6 bacterium GW2011_GWF2_30_66]|jgi:cell division protease FtsH|nr:MAG: ATP-dependent zinc metalloprotease FtsH [candidate division TM6 bacterium GW2011_GWF2_30_66]
MKRKIGGKNLFKGPKGFIIVAIVFVIFALLATLDDISRGVKKVNYSTFLKMVERGQVKKVKISGQDVYGELKDDSKFETVIAYNPKNWDILKEHDVDFEVTNQSGGFSIWYLLSFLSFLATLGFIWYIFKQAKGGQSGSGGGNNVFSMGKSRHKLFMPTTIKENFDSVAGAAEAKEDLKDVVDFLKSPEKFKRLGAKITRGVLLIGEPGNGKTLLAKAVAGEANCPFFSISGSDFIEVFVGVGASRVRDLFAQARKNAPSIIFIDEIDAVGRTRGSGLGGGHDEREQTLNQLLTEMDGFQTTSESVIVLAATNRPDVLDKALLRPGRFDRRVHVPYPDLVSREQILNVHAKNVKIDMAVDLAKIARGTPGFSGADLANLINEAAINASKTNQKTVTVKDFEEASDKILLGKEIKTMVQTPQDLKITSYHESGHSLIRVMLPQEADPLHKVTIIPRGRALGVSHSLPERDKHTLSKKEMLASIAIALGGRAAEDLVFNKITTGAYSDFKVATDMARDMVCYYGMSDLGIAVYRQGDADFAYSQKTAEKIDEQVNKILDESYNRAKDILQQNRDKLDKLAEALLARETMFAGEVYELLGVEPRIEHKF